VYALTGLTESRHYRTCRV